MEHLKFDNEGNFKGLYTISADKAKEVYKNRMWEGVDHIIKDYMRIHPKEMQEQIFYNKVTKDENFNKFGSDKTGTYRHAMELPIGLHNVLTEYEPDLFTNRTKLNKLMKKYPALCACAVT